MTNRIKRIIQDFAREIIYKEITPEVRMPQSKGTIYTYIWASIPINKKTADISNLAYALQEIPNPDYEWLINSYNMEGSGQFETMSEFPSRIFNLGIGESRFYTPMKVIKTTDELAEIILNHRDEIQHKGKYSIERNEIPPYLSQFDTSYTRASGHVLMPLSPQMMIGIQTKLEELRLNPHRKR